MSYSQVLHLVQDKFPQHNLIISFGERYFIALSIIPLVYFGRMSLAKLAAKAKSTKPKNLQKIAHKPYGKKNVLDQDNYMFDFSINYRDVEKFSQCKKFLSIDIGKSYGECAIIIDHGEHFVPRRPHAPTVEEMEAEDDAGLIMRMEYQAKYTNYIKQRTDYDARCAQVYHFIWGKCTLAMQQAVKQDPLFMDWDRDKDALSLC